MPAQERLSSRELALRREYLRAEGRFDAFKFALDCKGSQSVVEAEIQDSEQIIARGTGSMAPTASPRLYRESYLQGLKDALRIIREDSTATDSR